MSSQKAKSSVSRYGEDGDCEIVATCQFPFVVRHIQDILNFKFHDPFPEEENTIATNGLCFGNSLIPELIVFDILTYIKPEDALNLSLVCKKWCNMIKSHEFWADKYHRKYNKSAKNLPWYVYYCLFSKDYFDVNLIRNGNGQEEFKHWHLWGKKVSEHLLRPESVRYRNPGDGDPDDLAILPPEEARLPEGVPEFNGSKSCFASSLRCNKQQHITFKRCPLMIYVINHFKPLIYVSEWVAALPPHPLCQYTLTCNLSGYLNPVIDFMGKRDDEEIEFSERGGADVLHSQHLEHILPRGTGWKKVDMIVKDYPKGIVSILFDHHGGRHYYKRSDIKGCKMAGGVVKIMFDSIDEQPEPFPKFVPKKPREVGVMDAIPPFVKRTFESFPTLQSGDEFRFLS